MAVWKPPSKQFLWVYYLHLWLKIVCLTHNMLKTKEHTYLLSQMTLSQFIVHILEYECVVSLTLKALSKFKADDILNFILLFFRENMTWHLKWIVNVKPYFLWRHKIKYCKISSAVVVISILGVKNSLLFWHFWLYIRIFFCIRRPFFYTLFHQVWNSFLRYIIFVMTSVISLAPESLILHRKRHRLS